MWCGAEFLRPIGCPVGSGRLCDLVRAPKIGPFGNDPGIRREWLPIARAAGTIGASSWDFGGKGDLFGCILGSIRARPV
jgi:hypothetical protein